jgi:hypothetical protein
MQLEIIGNNQDNKNMVENLFHRYAALGYVLLTRLMIYPGMPANLFISHLHSWAF